MKVETKWNIGDRVWSFIKREYEKDVPCDSCNGNGGANIPGTKIRVECDRCGGDGTVKAPWYSFDVWFAQITHVTVEAEWRVDNVSIRYHMRGFWDDGKWLGADFSASESRVFADKEPAYREAKRLADQLDDARVSRDKTEPTVIAN